MNKNSLRSTRILSNIVIVVMLISLSIFCFAGSGALSVISLNTSQPFYKGNEKSNNVSLMINVYWGTEYLDEMLSTLKKYNAKCTFFVGGCWADKNNDYVNKILEQGHEIGNHGYFHKDHKTLNEQQNRMEIANTNKLIKVIADYDIKLFAPPSGAYSKITLEVANQLDMRVIMWSKDTIDWRDKDENLVYTRATKNASGGDLILMHPTAHTAKALPKILQEYKKVGLKAVTVSENIFVDNNTSMSKKTTVY